jgi:GT2 family glycosyltransferase
MTTKDPISGHRSSEASGGKAVDVSVIVVTWNSASYIKECLVSILGQEGVVAELILVDNASADETVPVVRDIGGDIQLVVNNENVGFGRACNQGFGASRGKLLFMLNPDTQLVGRDFLARLCRAMEQNPRWGMAGTRVVSWDGKTESLPATSYPGQVEAHCDFSALPGRIAWVLGASMVFRREVFAAVRGFDPAFFLYSEETDLCLRVRQSGHEIGYIPELTVRHIGGASEDGVDPYETHLRRMKGLQRFWAKHYPPEAVRRMARKDLLRAGFRKRWYGLLAAFSGRASRAWLKHREYAGISEGARRVLAAGSNQQ